MSNRLLIAIIDRQTMDVVGQIQTFKNANVAVRMFDDILRDTQINPVNKFPKDHELWRLAELTDELEIIPNKELILSGETWLQMQQPNTEQGEAR